METPRTRYAKTIDGVNIAYQVRGDGPVDLVYAVGSTGNFEVELEEPRSAAYFAGLASFSRLVLFDKRGTGLSDRTPDAPISRCVPTICGRCWTPSAPTERS